MGNVKGKPAFYCLWENGQAKITQWNRPQGFLPRPGAEKMPGRLPTQGLVAATKASSDNALKRRRQQEKQTTPGSTIYFLSVSKHSDPEVKKGTFQHNTRDGRMVIEYRVKVRDVSDTKYAVMHPKDCSLSKDELESRLRMALR